MNTVLNRTEVVYLQNKSGGAIAQGDVMVVSAANAGAATTTTVAGYVSGLICVVLDPGGVADNAYGSFALAGYVPKINLSASASLGDLFKTHSVAKQAAPHAAPLAGGDFGMVLGTGTSPAALLVASPAQDTTLASYFAPSGLSGATQASRYVGSVVSIAPTTGTFAVGDYVIAHNGKVFICTAPGSPGTWVQVGATAAPDYIHVRDEKPNGTDGGYATGSAWNVRNINTEVSDVGGHCSIGSNQITLEAGTYECRISAPTWSTNQHKCILYNVSDLATEIVGTAEYCNTGTSSRSHVVGKFTISSSKIFEIRHWLSRSGGVDALGVRSVGGGEVEVYTTAEFWKVA